MLWLVHFQFPSLIFQVMLANYYYPPRAIKTLSLMVIFQFHKIFPHYGPHLLFYQAFRVRSTGIFRQFLSRKLSYT